MALHHVIFRDDVAEDRTAKVTDVLMTFLATMTWLDIMISLTRMCIFYGYFSADAYIYILQGQERLWHNFRFQSCRRIFNSPRSCKWYQIWAGTWTNFNSWCVQGEGTSFNQINTKRMYKEKRMLLILDPISQGFGSRNYVIGRNRVTWWELLNEFRKLLYNWVLMSHSTIPAEKSQWYWT